MKLRTIGLAFVATAFMAGSALAQSGTMQPIPNPPEKAKVHHKKKHKAAAPADAAKPAEAAKPADAAMPAKSAKPAEAAKPATPPKK